jgi:predicted ester cyclase
MGIIPLAPATMSEIISPGRLLAKRPTSHGCPTTLSLPAPIMQSDNTTTAYRAYLDAKKIATMARRFPRAIFTIGADAATWSPNTEFDHYVTTTVMGIAETGRNVASGVHLFKKLDEHRHFDGDWHYKHKELAVEAFVDNIAHDIKYARSSQSGTRVFKK